MVGKLSRFDVIEGASGAGSAGRTVGPETGAGADGILNSLRSGTVALLGILLRPLGEPVGGVAGRVSPVGASPDAGRWKLAPGIPVSAAVFGVVTYEEV
jgi:hypothetical protein